MQTTKKKKVFDLKRSVDNQKVVHYSNDKLLGDNIISERIIYEEDKRPSQIKEDFRSQGSHRSLKDISDIDKMLIIDPERHYKNKEK